MTIRTWLPCTPDRPTFDDRHQQALGELSSLPRCDTPWLSSSFYPISSGPACSDDQKANLLAITLKDNFTENERPNGDYPIDNTITTTLENFFFLSPPPLPITPTDPDEVLNYIKTLSNHKAPELSRLPKGGAPHFEKRYSSSVISRSANTRSKDRRSTLPEINRN
ncbi:hypothetical protein TNCV_3523601 [Trichonephila clavipes]|nr:hypothetical protein TNCV_3523601 [Trichonephila clavipes]